MLVQKLRVDDLQSEEDYFDGVMVYAQNKVGAEDSLKSKSDRDNILKSKSVQLKKIEVRYKLVKWRIICCFFPETAGGANRTLGQNLPHCSLLCHASWLGRYTRYCQ